MSSSDNKMKLVHVLGQLTMGPCRSMMPSPEGFPQYGVGELCEWLWANKATPCTLMLTVCGGDVDAAHALMAAMRYHGSCNTFGLGYVASAGVDVLHTGRLRGLHPDCVLMTHRGSRISNAKLRAMCETRDRKIYTDAPDILSEWHLVFPARDRHWTAEEALVRGFIDYVHHEPSQLTVTQAAAQ